MLRHRLLIIVLLTTLALGLAGGADAAFYSKKETRKQKREQRKELKKKGKQEHKQAKLQKKKEKAANKKATLEKKKNTPSRVQKKQQQKELKKKQRQDRKNLKKELKKRKKAGTAIVNVPHPPPPSPVIVKKKREIIYPRTQMKPRYRIDVLAPMYLDDLVKDGSVTYKDKMPEKATAGIAFYEGVSIAADSLKRAGFNIDIYVHDVASAAESADMLVKKGSLDTADLIIGAVQSHDIPMLADYAKRKQINFISVLSASDAGVRDNEYFTMIQPSLKSHCMWIDSDVSRKFTGLKPAIIYRTSVPADSVAYSFITNDSGAKSNFKTLLCNSLPHKNDLLALFDTTKPNVVIVPVLDNTYADSLLKELSHDFPATHFEVYGMPSWNSIPSLRSGNPFPNLTIDVTTAVKIDPSTAAAKYVSHTFKTDYGGKASEIVYRGYETMFWYANLLKYYGTFFNTKYSDNTTAPFTKFEIKPSWDKNDDLMFNENTRLYLTKYESGNTTTE